QGGRGSDTALLGTGDDTFVWNPGEGSDIVEGQDGSDRMIFNGANVNEEFDVSANGTHVRFTRDVGNVVMDLSGLEEIDLSALGGKGIGTVNRTTGTDLQRLGVDLSGVPGSGVGDCQADSISLFGSDQAETVDVVGTGSSFTVNGLAAAVN